MNKITPQKKQKHFTPLLLQKYILVSIKYKKQSLQTAADTDGWLWIRAHYQPEPDYPEQNPWSQVKQLQASLAHIQCAGRWQDESHTTKKMVRSYTSRLISGRRGGGEHEGLAEHSRRDKARVFFFFFGPWNSLRAYEGIITADCVNGIVSHWNVCV